MASTRPTTVVYVATSIDGYIARPDGGLDWLGSPGNAPDDKIQASWTDFFGSLDHMVMGRKTFEQVLEFDAWPYEGVHVTVLSKTLDGVPEQVLGKADVSTLDPSDLLGHLAGLNRRRVYVDGGQVIQSFLRADLIDELIINTIPVLIGAGIPLFGNHDADLTWEHVGTRNFRGGLVQTHYRRCR
jgi:dihydrofolate reductase